MSICKTTLPEADYVREMLDLNFESGGATWKERPRHHFKTEQAWKSWNKRFCGKAAGGKRYRPNGGPAYVCLYIDNKRYLLHHLVWLLKTGNRPFNEVDHIDRNPHNNAWDNLRLVDHGTNMKNKHRCRDNRSGVTGVSLMPSGKWRARINVNKDIVSLGVFSDKGDADNAVRVAKLCAGYTAWHGS